MGDVINYEEYRKHQSAINESPEASVFVMCDYLTYAVKHINLSTLTPDSQKELVDAMDDVLQNMKSLLNNNDIQGNRFYCFNPEFSQREKAEFRNRNTGKSPQ